MREKRWNADKKFVTKSGVKVRSKIEKIILDLYYDWGINVEYEKEIVFPRLGKVKGTYTVFCDFYLPDYDIWHEHFGMDDPTYLEKATIKKNSFQYFRMKFIATDIEDEANIEKAIIGKLGDIGVEVE